MLCEQQAPEFGECIGRRLVEYYDMTLTNLATGHVYSLDPISRDYP